MPWGFPDSVCLLLGMGLLCHRSSLSHLGCLLVDILDSLRHLKGSESTPSSPTQLSALSQRLPREEIQRKSCPQAKEHFCGKSLKNGVCGIGECQPSLLLHISWDISRCFRTALLSAALKSLGNIKQHREGTVWLPLYN